MRTTATINSAARILTVAAAALILMACGGKNWFTYTGWEAKPENRQTLKKGGPHAEVWRSTELDLHYRYRLEGDQLHIDGKVVPNNPIQNFHYLRAWINIHLLDENGIVLDTHRLWSEQGSDVYGARRWDFSHSWQLPTDNEAVGFSFTGTAGYGGENSPQWRFWQTP